jgi:glycosyltransferase involved in cell wall biosynthesis
MNTSSLENKSTSQTVLLINCDWRNLFQNNQHELWEKLERDRLCPDQNNFFIFSWAKQSYTADGGNAHKNWRTVHKKTRFSWFKPWFDMMSYFSVPKALQEQKVKPDIIAVYDFGFLPTAKKVQKMYGSKIVMVINNMPRLYSAVRRLGWLKSWYSHMLEKLFKDIPDAYFTINDAMKTYLLELGIPESNVHMFAMDTINRDMQFIEQSIKGTIRAKYNLPGNAKVLVCVARLEAEKGYERLLNLFATLSSEYHLFILGEGSLRKELEAQCARLGIHERVHMPGFIRRNEIWNYYQDADAFVLLSKVEALGVVVWEAMYMNVPVLGSVAPGIIESTGSHEERGFVLKDSEGEKEFKEKLVKALQKDPVMLKHAREYVIEKIQNKLTLNDIL